MKHFTKRLVICFVIAALTVLPLSGCGMNPNATVLKVGSEKVSLGLANFAARYNQSTYETYYGISDTAWGQNAVDDQTYEEYVKKEVMNSLKKMVLERQHMGDYKVKLTDDEKSKIKKAVAAFIKANGKEAKEAVTADQSTVEEYLELLTIQNKMDEAIKENADVKVTDKEAAQKKMQYAYFSFSSTDEAGNVTLFEDDEKAALKKTAEAFAKTAADAKDFKADAEAAGASVEEATFDKSSTTPDKGLTAAAAKLKAGQVTPVIEGETGFYVAKVTSDLDKEATKTKKDELIAERKNEAVSDMIKKWKKETKTKVKKRQWKKVSFEKQGVKMKTEDAGTTAAGE